MKPSLELVTQDTCSLVALDKILHLEADGSYTKVFYKKNKIVKEHVESRHLKTFEKQLDERFVRIHRSRFVNSDKVTTFNIKTHTVTLNMPDSPNFQVARRTWRFFRNLIRSSKNR